MPALMPCWGHFMADSLTVAMTAKTDLTLTRHFQAAPALLWRAITDPAILPRWQWAQDWPMVQCAMDLRVGGTFRWVWQTAPDRLVGLKGRFLTAQPPHRLIHTEVFDEDWTGGATTVTQNLTETARRAAAACGMVPGMAEAYARLDTVLPHLTV